MLKQTLLEEKVPVYLLEIEPSECLFDSIEEIADHFIAKIKAHHTASYIASFDHFAHTNGLPNGQIAEDIKAAINIVFCFGLTLPEPGQLANRPRSIGICETENRYTISFMECPMPVANALIEEWANSLYTPMKKPRHQLSVV